MDTHSTTIPVKLTLLFSTYIFFQDRNFPTVKQKSSRVKTKQVEKTTEKFFGFFFLPRNRKMSGFTAAPSHRFDFEKKRKNKNYKIKKISEFVVAVRRQNPVLYLTYLKTAPTISSYWWLP
jgi:hypothetical protein